MREVMRGHALQHGRRGGMEIHVLGDLDELGGRHHRVFRVGAARHGIGHAVARSHLGHPRAHGLHGARALAAERDRKIGLIQPGAEVNIDEVDAAGRDAHQRLPAGPDAGVGTSTNRMCSGPPVSLTSMAFISRCS